MIHEPIFPGFNGTHKLMRLISDTTISNVASVDVTGLAGYSHLFISLYRIVPQTDGQDLFLRISTDNGSTWKSGANYLTSTRSSGAGIADTITDNINSSACLFFAYNIASLGMGTGTNETFNSWIYLSMGTANGIMQGYHETVYISEAGVVCFTGMERGFGYDVAGTEANAIQLLMASGNLASGRIRVYAYNQI